MNLLPNPENVEPSIAPSRSNSSEEQAPAETWRSWLLPLGYVSAVILFAAVWLSQPGRHSHWQYDLTAMVVAALGNSYCALLGTYLLLRRMSLLGDAISHALLPGIVLAFVFTGQVSGWPLLVGAVLLAILTSVLAELLQSQGNVGEDTSLGVVYTCLFALGVIMVQVFGKSTHLDVDCALYGQLELAALEPRRTLLTGGVILGLVLLVIALFWKELKLASFDPAIATAMGISAVAVHYVLIALVAVVSVSAFEAVGSILVVAMLIVPAACAQMMAQRLLLMLVWSVVFGISSALLGYWAADMIGTTASGMMALVAGLQMALVVCIAPKQGLISRWLRQASLGIRIAREDILATLYRAEEVHAGAKPSARVSTIPTDWRHRIARWRLLSQGLVEPIAAPLGLQLTTAGKESAQQIVRAHRLWEAFLEKHFVLPPDHLHDPAERMEHFLDPALQAQLDQELAGKTVDPHGKQIPPPLKPTKPS